VRRYKEAHDDWEEFPEKVAFQMNDTHPTLLGELVCKYLDHQQHAACTSLL
jgi:starch phosphorylase